MHNFLYYENEKVYIFMEIIERHEVFLNENRNALAK